MSATSTIVENLTETVKLQAATIEDLNQKLRQANSEIQNHQREKEQLVTFLNAAGFKADAVINMYWPHRAGRLFRPVLDNAHVDQELSGLAGDTRDQIIYSAKSVIKAAEPV